VRDDDRDVFTAFAERGHGQFDRCDAVVEVLPEPAFSHGTMQLGPHAREEAEVDAAGLGCADRTHLAHSKDAEEFRWKLERQLVEVREAKGSSVGESQEARAGARP
jgi:hypothetical protein